MNKEFTQWLDEKRYLRYKGGWKVRDNERSIGWNWEYIIKEAKYRLQYVSK